MEQKNIIPLALREAFVSSITDENRVNLVCFLLGRYYHVSVKSRKPRDGQGVYPIIHSVSVGRTNDEFDFMAHTFAVDMSTPEKYKFVYYMLCKHKGRYLRDFIIDNDKQFVIIVTDLTVEELLEVFKAHLELVEAELEMELCRTDELPPKKKD